MKKITFLMLFLGLLFLPIHMMGQEYVPLTVSSGFNEDVIAEDSPASTSTTVSVDAYGTGAFGNGDNAFVVSGAFTAAGTAGFPVSGTFPSEANPDITFQLGDYAEDNVLRLESGSSESGTLTFQNQQEALKIYVLATGGNGACTFTGTITFTDDTTQDITSQTVPDWYNQTSAPIAYYLNGRIHRGTDTWESATNNPRLYQIEITIDAANQAKQIESIQFVNTQTNSGRFLNIFGVSAEIIPDCPKPTNLSVSDITAQGATVNWESIGDSFELKYGITGFDVETEGISEILTTTSFAFTNTEVTEGQTYDVYVRRDCDADGFSNWTGPLTFTPEDALIYNSGDISTQYQATWSNPITTTSVSSCPGTLTLAIPAGKRIASISTEYDMTTGGFAYMSEQYSYIYSPELSTGESNVVQGTGTGGTMVYNNRSLDFAIGATGTITFELRAFRSFGGSGCGTDYNKVDDGTWKIFYALEDIPSCLEPADLTATDITATGATLSWTSDGSLFDVEILEEGEDPTGVPTYEGVSNNFTTTIPLTGSTIYNYWVRQDCGDDDLSIWAGPYSFTTACVPVETLPYVESFDTYGTGSNAFPLCWERPVTHTYSSVIYPSIVSGASTSSPHSLRLMADPSTPTYAITPAFTEDINNLRVTFQLRKEGANSGTVDFGVMSDPNDLSTFELVETIDPSNTNFNEYVFYLNETELSGGNNYIAFKHNSNSGSWFIWIDDFVVDEIPTCFPPLNIEVDNITTESAELTWEMPDMGNTPGDGYEIEIRTAGEPGEPEGFVATMSATDLTAILADLDPGTAYTVYIKTLCTEDTDESVWESISFATACELPDAPANITFTDITATATKVNYEAPATAPTGYVIFRSTSDVPPVLVNGTNYPVNNSTAIASLTDGDNTYFSVYNGTDLVGNVTSLTSNTEYYYYVFSRSAENDCFGAPWYSELSVTDSEVTAPATPTAAAVSNHADTSATISWTASNVGGEVGAITYTLEVYTDSEYENPITGSPFEMGADVSQDLTGLAVSTQYFFRIKANNTFHDSGYLTGNFATTQVPATLNYEQDFEETHGWAFTNNDSHENNWYVSNATGNPGSSLYVSKDGGVSNEYNTSGTRVVHAYRDIAVPAGTSDATISFDWKGQGETPSWDYFRVWLAPASYLPSAGTTQISSGSGRIQVGGNFNGETDWTAYENNELDLSSFAGQTMRLIFEWKNDYSSGSGNAAAIDNIEITLPDCSKPTDLTIDNLTQESADLVWASLGNIFDVKWGETGFDIENEGVLEEGFENGGTLSGLEADTDYEYYVRQDCGADGVSAWAGPYAFYTGYCTPGTTTTNNSDVIANFTLNNLSNDSEVGDPVAGYSDYTVSVAPAELQAGLSYVASLTSASGTGNHGAAIWIDYNNNLVFDEDEMVAFIPNTISASSTVNFPEFTVPATIEPGLYRLRVQYRFNASGSSFTPCYVGSYNETEDYMVNILPPPTCFPPLNIEVGNITKNSAEATWEIPELGNTPEDGYEIEIRTAGAPGEAEGFVATVNTTDLSATLSGLEASTTYTIYIKSLCTEDTDESFWSAGVTFTTLCEYPDFELVNSEEDLILCGPNTIELEVASDGIINWYDAADATEPIFTGTTFETDELSETTSFWFEAAEEGSPTTLGPVSPSAQGGTIANQTAAWNVNFTVTESTTLLSIDIFPNNLGVTGNIQLRQGTGGTVIETIPYTTSVSGGATAQTIELNFELEPGTYNLYPSLPSGGITRNTSGASYPYTSDVASITGNGWDQTFYMGFYNWVFDGVCKSPREEVVVTVNPIIDVTGAEVINITGPTATLVIESDAETFDIEYGETGFAQGTGTLVTEQESPYLIEGLTEDLVYDVYIRATESCGEWYELSFTATAPSEPQEITAEDVTKVYGDAPFTHGSSDSGLALTYVIADQTVATFVGGQLVIQGAGETEVTAKQAGNSEFLPAEDVTFTLTVTKADLIVTAEDQTKVYDGVVFEDWTVIYEGFVYEDQASDLSGELVYEGDAATAINAGTYTIEVSGLLSDNYTINYEEGSLIITKATLEGITFEDQTVTYDGEEKSIFITGDLPAGVTVTYTGNEQTEIGDYEVTAHIDGGTNYEDMELEAVMSIRGVLTDIMFEDAEFTYDGTAKSIFITGDLPEGVTVTYTGNAQTEAGEYEVVANIEGGEFYSDLELTATLTINKATISGIVFTDAEFVYNCTAHSLAITGELPEGVTVSYENNGNVESGTYTVTANINGGENYEDLTLTAVMTIVELLPTIADQFSCGALLVADVEANLPTGWETKWYAGATSTDAIETILTSGVYYVSSSYNDCESSRIEVQVTIEDVNIPTGNAQQQFCISGQVSDLVVEHTTGTTLQVYETPTGGVALNANYSLYNGTFYVSEKIGDCESARLAIQVTITPSVPALSPAEFVICGHQLLSTIELDNLPNAELVWYANATTPQAMSASVQITSGTFYVSQKIGVCESLRVPIVFEVQQVLPQPTATSIQQFCISAIVSELVATGAPNAVFKWYASATSATPLESTATLQNGTYYVSQELNGCESARRAVSVIITNLTAPQATSFEFCGSATVADFSMPVISGVTYNWYLPNQSTPLPSTHVLTNGNYLVKKAQNGCESNSAIVQVTIKPIPNSPTGQLEQEFIDSAMISDLEMDQPGVVWYITYEDALNGNNPLQANMPLQDGNVYYGVLIGANGCPSLPVAVTVTITLGVKDLDLASLKYYPNPVETELTVSYKAPINSLEVYDLTGKLIKTQAFDSNDVRLDVSSLSSGTYMIKVHTSVGSQFIKIVKK